MTQVDNLDFKVTVPLEKTERDGKWIIAGVATGAGFVDSAGDEMLPQAIEGLAAQINDSPVPLRDSHKKDSILEDIGVVVKADVTPGFQLLVEAELDQKNPSSIYLWNKLDEGKKYGLSVKGHSEKPIVEKSMDRYVSKHHTVSLDEVSVTTRPYFTHSFGTVLRKAMDEALAPLATMGDTNMENSKTGEAPVQESSAPENDTAQDSVSPSEELVKSLMADDEFKTLIADTVKAAIAETAPATDSVEDTTEVEKSESEADTTAPDMAEIVKSVATELNASVDAKIEAMLDRIADVAGPRVIEKTEADEAKEVIEQFKTSSPQNRLRVGLAAKHDQLDRL